MIVAFEVTSRAVYERRYRAPTWPGGASGVTIGIGYDLGYVKANIFKADWGASLPARTIETLSVACGVTGEAAGAMAAGFAEVLIGWEEAEHVFRTRTLPLYTALVEHSLPNTEQLGADCLGSLVSLVYSLGASFRHEGERFREMRAILEHMQRGNLAAIPAQLRSMRRLWESDPGMARLLRRREAEAALFERGLETTLAGALPPAPAATKAAIEGMREGLHDALDWAKAWIGRAVVEPTRDMVLTPVAPPDGMPEMGEDVEPGETYVSMRILSARIEEARRWTSLYHAAVHARCDMLYEGGEGRIERQMVLAPVAFRNIDPKGGGRTLQMDRPLFGASPYYGELNFSIGLFAVKSTDLAGPYLALLGQLAETGAFGFLKAAEPFIAPLRSGVELLFGKADAAEVKCGVARGPRPLRTGIWACLGATRDQVPNAANLRLSPGDFRLLEPEGRPVESYPYVVFTIERSTRRDDWMAIPDLREAWETLRRAVREGGEATRRAGGVPPALPHQPRPAPRRCATPRSAGGRALWHHGGAAEARRRDGACRPRPGPPRLARRPRSVWPPPCLT
jgi:GH24 family phage-related lysozyme (muramidase)